MIEVEDSEGLARADSESLLLEAVEARCWFAELSEPAELVQSSVVLAWARRALPVARSADSSSRGAASRVEIY